MRATESGARTADPPTKTERASARAVKLRRSSVRQKCTPRASPPRWPKSGGGKNADDKKSDDTANATESHDAGHRSRPSVANANAQLHGRRYGRGQSREEHVRPGGQRRCKAARQNPPTGDAASATTRLVSADQLNEVDRQLSDETPAPQPTLAMASMTTASASNADSTWEQTSLIGKIFIAFGGLLTLASAARMFMA